MNLRNQYNKWRKQNPEAQFTFEEWHSAVWEPQVTSLMSYEEESDLSAWDSTLLDGLEDNPWEE